MTRRSEELSKLSNNRIFSSVNVQTTVTMVLFKQNSLDSLFKRVFFLNYDDKLINETLSFITDVC